MENITTVIVSIAVIIKLFYVIKYLINKFREYNLVKNFSGPKAFPIIGNSHLFLGNMEGTVVFHISNVNINVNKILSNSPYGFEKGQLYDGLIDLLGNGLVTASSKLQEHMIEILLKQLNYLYK
ncbi:hypothetical protein M0802_014195, partial [Mischocyttarus mexicanus]